VFTLQINEKGKSVLKMDIDTLILMILLGVAFSCWFTILIKEERQLMKQSDKKEKDKLVRAERVKRLMNKL
jgi:Mg2+/Co2+ transporter CorB